MYVCGSTRFVDAAADGLLELGGHLLGAPRLDERWLDRGAGVRVREAALAAQRTFAELQTAAATLASDYESYEGLDEDLPERLGEATTANFFNLFSKAA